MRGFLSVGVLLLGLTCAEGCWNNQPNVGLSDETGDKLKGVSLSPLSFQPADFTDFFVKAKQAGNIVGWARDWNELNTDNGPKVVAELAATYNYTPLIELRFFAQSTGVLLRQLDDATKQVYKNNAVAFADKYKLKYLGIGIEVNTLSTKSPAD